MQILVLTVVAIALAMLIMAVGVIFKRRCLRGSCGGPRIFDSESEALICASCGRRDENQKRDESEASVAGLPAGPNGQSLSDKQENPEMVSAVRRADE